MTNANTPAVQPRRFKTATQPTKTPRSELVSLEIETDDCPQVLLRILGLIARDGSIPATIGATRSDDRIAIAIELDRVTETAGERIALKVCELPTVRKVWLAGRRID
ncbi:hypothetical protein [Sphingomonas sp.]|uniref:hypothetical protein n=1 Tax=Sphingomonas sp. TaxID=28214 RepID=UPI0025E3EF11|nr:hypothetical protein [Sphingomonas sp.]